MKFIEALKLKSKLFLTFLFITFGLVAIGFMGTSYTNSLKKNIDALYFGSFIPVTELHTILHQYDTTLAMTLYKAKHNGISNDEVASNIQEGLQTINTTWNRYINHYKTQEEKEYVAYVSMEIEKANSYFLSVVDALKHHKDITKLSIPTLQNVLDTVNGALGQLLAYEVQSAQDARQNFLYTYKDVMIHIGSMLVLIIVGVLGVLLYVFRSIQNNHTHLQKVARKLKKLNKQLQNASYTDTLTSLHNRRYFNFIYERELKRAKRAKTYIAFMMIDIDFFKQYNDTYGHIEGDHALKAVAEVLQEHFKRPSDYVFRLGGEEFGVLLSETDQTHTARLAREICQKILERKIEHKNSKVSPYLTLSIGVACCIADNALDDELLISRADEMLYKSKHTGRNRYTITTDIVTNKQKKTEQMQNIEIA